MVAVFRSAFMSTYFHYDYFTDCFCFLILLISLFRHTANGRTRAGGALLGASPLKASKTASVLAAIILFSPRWWMFLYWKLEFGKSLRRKVLSSSARWKKIIKEDQAASDVSSGDADGRSNYHEHILWVFWAQTGLHLFRHDIGLPDSFFAQRVNIGYAECGVVCDSLESVKSRGNAKVKSCKLVKAKTCDWSPWASHWYLIPFSSFNAADFDRSMQVLIKCLLPGSFLALMEDILCGFSLIHLSIR